MCVQVRRKEGGAVVVKEEFRDCPPADSATTAPNRAHFEDDFSFAAHLSINRPGRDYHHVWRRWYEHGYLWLHFAVLECEKARKKERPDASAP